MTHIDLFSGIGGFALAAEAVWPGIEHIFCDNDPFSQAILKKHWPKSKIYGDIRTFTNAESKRTRGEPSEIRGEDGGQDDELLSDVIDQSEVFILTGGFPCQPFSQAGRRKGTDDDRYLWPEMFRVIREFHPRWVIAENVSGLVTWNEGLVLETACTDLESEGYEVQPFIIPACAVGAPHRRDRVWIAAYAEGERSGGCASEKCGTEKRKLESEEPEGCEVWGESERCVGWTEPWPEVATRLCRLDDGLPNGLPRPKGWRNAALKAYGNAIVPAVAEQIMKAIKETENKNNP